MFLWVSAALRQHIISEFDLDKSTVDEMLEQVSAEEISAKSTNEKKKVEKLADALKDEGLVTVDMLLMALAEGEVPLFISLFSKVSKLREHLVQRLLFEQGGEGLAITCKAIGMSSKEFVRLFELSNVAKAGTQDDIKKRLPLVETFYESTPRKAAIDVVRLWHRGSDYLGALRELEVRLRDHDNA